MTIRRKTSAAAVLALAAAALPAAAKDYLLVPARPDKLVIVDAGAMAIDKVIQLDGAGPLPQLPVVSKDGSRAYVMMNMLESIAIVDLVNGKTLGRIEMSGAEERVKGMFGMDLSPDGKTLVVYQSPVKMLADEFQVQPTRLAFYDAETGELRSTAEVPRQITLVAWSEDGSRIYGMGRKMYVFDATGKQIEEKPIHGWQTETYARATLEVDAERWRGVPVTIASGKAVGDPESRWASPGFNTSSAYGLPGVRVDGIGLSESRELRVEGRATKAEDANRLRSALASSGLVRDATLQIFEGDPVRFHLFAWVHEGARVPESPAPSAPGAPSTPDIERGDAP